MTKLLSAIAAAAHAPFIARFFKINWIKLKPIDKPSLMRKLCGNAKSGLSRFLAKLNNGMGWLDSDYGNYGV